MKSRVTTGKGDAGDTTLLDGTPVPKSHPLIAATGAVDELRAHTALARQFMLRDKPRDWERLAEFLLWVLHTYFLIGTACSDPGRRRPELWKGELGDQHLAILEREQARLEQDMSVPELFVLSARSVASAQVDVACTAARRLERVLVELRQTVPEIDHGALFTYVNRLSDCLFVLARYLDEDAYLLVDYERLG